MNQIEIAPITVQPDPSSEDFICSFPDFLLGHIFESVSQITTKDSDAGFIEWRSEHDTLATTKIGIFRTLLARFGHHFLGGQYYGGSKTVCLRRGESEILVRLDLANSQREGFSLRATRKPAPNKAS